MDLSKTPDQLARDAAESIRALNHRTINPESYDTPPTLGNTAYSLHALFERLPQSLEQMEDELLRFGSTGFVRMDDGSDPTYAVAECVAALAAARPLLDQLLAEIRIVSARTSHMGANWPADELTSADTADTPTDTPA
ncbi:hypothetical protein [Streptomyces griseus]|uniref:hypothetical protein n=1 Tax=Streptomyces griseus TaxID=1911 RepID=UPI0037BAD323